MFALCVSMAMLVAMCVVWTPVDRYQAWLVPGKVHPNVCCQCSLYKLFIRFYTGWTVTILDSKTISYKSFIGLKESLGFSKDIKSSKYELYFPLHPLK